MSSVFLCYTESDKFVADAVCHHLESSGFSCCTSGRNFPGTTDSAKTLPEIMSDCSALVLICSGASAASDSMMEEITCALQSGCTIVPFRLNNAPVDFKISQLLGSVHWLDASSGSLQSNLEALCTYLKVILPTQNTTSSPLPQHAASPSGIGIKKYLLPAVLVIFFLVLFLTVFGSGKSKPKEPVSAAKPTAAAIATEAELIPETTQVPLVEINHLGGTYYGTVSDDQPHGEGTLTWDECYYEGSFENGYPCGEGTFYYSDGTSVQGDSWNYGSIEPHLMPGTYYGMLLDDQAAGLGTLDFRYGATYQGTFREDHPYGDGMYTYLNCSSISGFWDWNTNIMGTWVLDRQGAEMFYTGMACDGVFSGYGYLIFSSGGSFLGEFSCNNPEGWGVYSYREPRSEDKKLMEGDNWTTVFGDYRYKNDYYGLKLNGKWQGFGIGIMESGYAYCGEILNDYRDGFGELYTRKDVLERRGIYRGGELKESLPKS